MLVVLTVGGLACQRGEPPKNAHAADIFLRPESVRIEGTVPPSATFAEILQAHKVDAAEGRAFASAVEPVFSQRELKAHHPYVLERSLDGRVREFTYKVDLERFLEVRGASNPQPVSTETATGFEVEMKPYRVETALVAVRGAIDADHPSLVAAINAAGENATLAVALADIFDGEIDFDHDLRQGDRFEMVFERVLREGHGATYGAIVAAELVHGGESYTAYRYETPGGKPEYYDENGRSLRRFFLASPLKFEPRVTSSFSYRRLHPVLGVRRPHLGVDFGAPRGAPVVAVADARVVSARRTRGGGNTVSLRHEQGYESQYLHLSSFARGIRAGARIEQGTVIGRVGSTGLATGPHLHYVLKRGGTHLNPLAEHRKHPPGRPVPEAYRASFAQLRDDLRSRFVSAVPPDVVVVAAAKPTKPAVQEGQ
jgi:murein DD-endopeptidase MepM/ murein hydrolase activator NlpD